MSLIHITYRTHVKTKYMYIEIFKVMWWTLSVHVSSVWNVFIVYSWQEGEGSSEHLPLVRLLYADLGQNWHWDPFFIYAGVVGFVRVGVHTCHRSILVFSRFHIPPLLFFHTATCACFMETLLSGQKRNEGARFSPWQADKKKNFKTVRSYSLAFQISWKREAEKLILVLRSSCWCIDC